MSDNKHNGWTNYATWRVMLEMFDGVSPSDIMGSERKPTLHDLSQALKEWAESAIEQDGKGLALDYAMAFLASVEFHEIAQYMLEAYADDYADENEEEAA
mgnify:CR=1 FL=1